MKYLSTLRHLVQYFSTLRHLVKYFSTFRHLVKYFSALRHLVKYFSTLPHLVKYFSKLRHLVKYFSTLSHLVKYFSTLYATRWFTIMFTAPSHRPDLSHMNPVHVLQLYFFKFYINVILQPMLQFSKRSPTCRYFTKIFALVFRPIYATFLAHFLSY